MKLSATYKTEGTRQLEQALVQLGRKAGLKALTGALRDASKPILQEARASAPTKSGALKKGIAVQTFRGKGRSDSVATLHMGFKRKTAWYGQILERGADAHEIPNKNQKSKGRRKKLAIGKDMVRESVNHPGTKSYPMLKGSFEKRHPEAIKILKKRLYERIILESVKKYGKAA